MSCSVPNCTGPEAVVPMSTPEPKATELLLDMA